MAYEGNRYAGLNRKRPEDKAGWLGTAGTLAGAGLGLLTGPGGMAAGAKLGGALGGVTHDAVNGTLTPMGVLGSAAQGVSGFKGLGSAMDNKSILEAFMRDPSQFKVGFNTGGLVSGGGVTDQLLQMLQRQNAAGSPIGMGVPPGPTQTPQDPLGASSDVLGAIPGQVQQMIGRGPALPAVEDLQTARHPNWEAVSGVLSQLLAAMPKPANPRNTKAIGAWAPALGVLAGAPADIAQERRKLANADITTRNEARRARYEADKKAYDAQYGQLSNTLAGNATKPMAERATDAPLSVDMAKQLGHPEWAGLTESQVRLKMQGAPDKPKVEGPPSPKDRAGIANMILDNVRQDKDVSNFVTVRDNYNRIARMARNGSGVGDMSLIFAYMKVLDPTSVVRESEYKNAADAIGRIPQLANLPANWMVGSKLTPVGRAGFVKAAKDLYESQRMAYRSAIEMHRGFAQEYGIDPRLILRNYEALDAGVPEVNTDPAPGPTPPPAGRRTK